MTCILNPAPKPPKFKAAGGDSHFFVCLAGSVSKMLLSERHKQGEELQHTGQG